jgi:hypothetical protein
LTRSTSSSAIWQRICHPPSGSLKLPIELELLQRQAGPQRDIAGDDRSGSSALPQIIAPSLATNPPGFQPGGSYNY